VTDRSLLVRDYLDIWLAGKKLRLKRDTYLSYVEACELYFKREFAVIRAALNDAIPSKLLINPCDGVVLPRVDKAKPLVWTPAREARFRAELGKRTAAAETAADDEDRVLTTVERQALWAAKDLRPVPSMVWMPAHAGEFADYLDRTRERLAVLFIVAMYTGMRRDELLGLTWSEIDLDQGAAFVRETASGDGPKSPGSPSRSV
jgi:integrase